MKFKFELSGAQPHELVTLTLNMPFFQVHAHGIFCIIGTPFSTHSGRHLWRPTFACVLLLAKIPLVMSFHSSPTCLPHSSSSNVRKLVDLLFKNLLDAELARCSCHFPQTRNCCDHWKNGLFKASVDLTRGVRRAKTARNSRGLLRTSSARNDNSLREAGSTPAQDRQREEKPAQGLKTLMSRPLRP